MGGRDLLRIRRDHDQARPCFSPENVRPTSSRTRLRHRQPKFVPRVEHSQVNAQGMDQWRIWRSSHLGGTTFRLNLILGGHRTAPNSSEILYGLVFR